MKLIILILCLPLCGCAGTLAAFSQGFADGYKASNQNQSTHCQGTQDVASGYYYLNCD